MAIQCSRAVASLPALPQFSDQRGKIAIKDDRPGTTIPENKLQLVGGETPVQGHQHQARLRRTKETLHETVAVVGEHRDALSRRQTEIQQTVAQSIGALVNLADAETAIFDHVVNEFTVGAACGACTEKVSDIDVVGHA